MDERDLRLDGNGVAGPLQEAFGFDLTTAVGTCAECGRRGPVGELVAYARAPGLVLRCPGCTAVNVRLVRLADRVLVDLRGAAVLELRV
jgi:uncharacterized protein DUF6510